MARKGRIRHVEVTETAEGRYVVTTYEDASVVRRRVEEGSAPRRKPRKPFARAWRPQDKQRT